jgi:hypothetical protein
MLPEKKAEIYKRIQDYGYSRLVSGAHFRSDVYAGNIAGAAIAASPLNQEHFRDELKQVKVELRKASGLLRNYPCRVFGGGCLADFLRVFAIFDPADKKLPNDCKHDRSEKEPGDAISKRAADNADQNDQHRCFQSSTHHDGSEKIVQ